MTDWVFDSFIALLVLSLLMALYKVPAARKINKYALGSWSYVIATLSAGYYLFPHLTFDKRTLVYAALWGTGYAILTAMQMHVLHKHETSKVFPFTSLASNVLTVIGGVFILHEYMSFLQGIAVLLSIFLFGVAFGRNDAQLTKEILPAFMTIALLSTFNKFVQKIGAGDVEIYNFIFWQLFFAFISSIIIWIIAEKRIPKISTPKTEFIAWGLLIGIIQFAGTFWVIKALSTGPISIVYTIIGLYSFFTSVIAALLFRERITRKSLIFIFTSITIILLIKLG
jgi:uncharacterized membrane protein